MIDLQRPDRRFIRFSEIRDRLPAGDPLLGSSLVPVGVDLEGRLRLADLAQPEHAHLLVAGTTGSGKSEWLRVTAAGLLVSNTPQTLRLLLIDPKRNAFAALRDSPFLYAPIVYPAEIPVTAVLEELADEMDARYEQMARTGTDSLSEYVRRLGVPVPRIVCLCDEYADLVVQGRKEAPGGGAADLPAGGQGARRGHPPDPGDPAAQPRDHQGDARREHRHPDRAQDGQGDRVADAPRLLGRETLLGSGDLLFKDIGEPVRLQSAYLPPEERDHAFAQAGFRGDDSSCSA